MVTDCNNCNSVSGGGARSKLLTRKKTEEVLLHNWWLVKAQDKGLAVGGIAYLDGLGNKAFTSAAIIKRHDINCLEAADGTRVLVSGIINMSSTHQNGFSDQVCNEFLLGFPYNWEDCATSCAREEFFNNGSSTKEGGIISMLYNMDNLTSDDLHVTRIQDLLISDFGVLNNSMLQKDSTEPFPSVENGPNGNQNRPKEAEECCTFNNDGSSILDVTGIKTINHKTSGPPSAEEANPSTPSRGQREMSPSTRMEECHSSQRTEKVACKIMKWTSKTAGSIPSAEEVNPHNRSEFQSDGGMKKLKMSPTEQMAQHRSTRFTKKVGKRVKQTSKDACASPSTSSRVQSDGEMKSSISPTEQMEKRLSSQRADKKATTRMNKTSEATGSCPSRRVTRSVSKMSGTTFLCL